MSYWEAMTSFLADQELEDLDYLLPFAKANVVEVHPNPWTGVCTQLFILVALTGSLVRRKRIAARTVAAIRSSATRAMVLAELDSEARALEALLFEYRPPLLENIHDTEDENSTIPHLLVIAKCYRLAALLEIYRAFPNLFNQERQTRDSGLLCRGLSSSYHTLILNLGVAILTLLSSIPRNSGTLSSQVFPTLVAAATLKPCSSSLSLLADQSLDFELCEIFRSPAATKKWRDFVQERMTHLSRYIRLPLLNNFVRIIREVWFRFDCDTSEQNDMADPLPHHWVDIMSELHLEAILG